MKEIGSEITGILSQAEKDESSTGTPRGETGSGLARRKSSVSVMHPAIVQRGVRENTNALVSQMRSLNVDVRVEKETRWRTNPQTGEQTWYLVPLRAKLSYSDPQRLSEARVLMDHALACAPHETIIEWLARLNVTTKSQYRNEKDFILMAEAYLDELVKWPGDAVRETLTNWRDQWFPTLGAIKDAMKEIVGDRLMMARRLEQEP